VVLLRERLDQPFSFDESIRQQCPPPKICDHWKKFDDYCETNFTSLFLTNKTASISYSSLFFIQAQAFDMTMCRYTLCFRRTFNFFDFHCFFQLNSLTKRREEKKKKPIVHMWITITTTLVIVYTKRLNE